MRLLQNLSIHTKKNDAGEVLIIRSDPSLEAEEVTTLSKGHHRQTPNDQRSNSMNKNNPACHASKDNASNQSNPTSPAHQAVQDNRSRQTQEDKV